MADFFTPHEHGLFITVKARPGTTQRRPPRLVVVDDGRWALEITVAAAAEDGKANKAVLESVADLLGVKKAAVQMKSGTASRLKIVLVAGNPATLAARLKPFQQTTD